MLFQPFGSDNTHIQSGTLVGFASILQEGLVAKHSSLSVVNFIGGPNSFFATHSGVDVKIEDERR